MEKAREKAKKACEAYVAQIATANIVHHQYHQKDLPAVLERMQSLEETRLWNLSTALDQYAGVQDKFMQSIEVLATLLRSCLLKVTDGVVVNAVVSCRPLPRT